MKKIWDWFNGKKVTIGAVIWFVAKGLKLVPGFAPAIEVFDLVITGAEVLMGGGLIHKGIKTDVVQDEIDKVKNNLKK